MKEPVNRLAGHSLRYSGGVELLELAVLHDGDAVGERIRFRLVMRDEDHGQSALLLSRLQRLGRPRGNATLKSVSFSYMVRPPRP